MWRGIINQRFTPDQFYAYVRNVAAPKINLTKAWSPEFIVLHNTGSPTLAQRPNGFTNQHMLNLESFYRDTQNWSAGPHLFVDQNGIWAFTPLWYPGVHSPSWNKVAIGIEQVGDYDHDVYDSGQGAAVRDNAVAAMAILCDALGFDSASTKWHKEDPETTHKDCPGVHCQKADVLPMVHDKILALRAARALS
jgi:hypothetical protein